MRVLRPAVLLLISVPILILVINESRETPRALAQVAATTPNPGLVPPAAPGQPASFPTIGALPSLLPGPGTLLSAAATPLATPRVFRCTCGGGPGYKTIWSGNVPAANYFLADQAASTACTTYRTNAYAPSPLIGPRNANPFSQSQTLYNGTAFNSSALIGGKLANTAITINPVGTAQAAIEQQCTSCACN
jgi:hypothetical protein